MKAYWFEGDSGQHVKEGEIPANLLNFCKEKKLELIGQLAELDEKMEEYFLEENIEVPEAELKESIRKNTINLSFAPVFMGSAFKNKGVQLLLDGVLDYLPAPYEVENFAFDKLKNGDKTKMIIDSKKPFVGLAFKLEETQYGQLTWVRIY